ncbi:hypothetical protein RQP46_003306 [Phenoliferia psychrophenolica]
MKKAPTFGDIPDLEPPSDQLESTHLDNPTSSAAAGGATDEMPDMDDIPDMDDDDEEGGGGGGGLVEEEDEAALKPVATVPSDNLVSVRTYDCSITYDKYYQTPRMWLLGYDEHKRPLPPASALEDVSADHAQKTVTIEPFPHSSLSMASVHPCKHSSVMKKVIERMDAGVVEAQRRDKKDKEGKKGGVLGKLKPGSGKEKTSPEKEREKGDEEGPEGLRVDQYLVVFLKFMSSIVPTIEVDATNSI